MKKIMSWKERKKQDRDENAFFNSNVKEIYSTLTSETIKFLLEHLIYQKELGKEKLIKSKLCDIEFAQGYISGLGSVIKKFEDWIEESGKIIHDKEE